MTRWSANDLAAYLERTGAPGVDMPVKAVIDRPFGAPLTSSVVVELGGDPRGKGRPRFVRSTGHAYTPSKTRKYEDELRSAGQSVMLTAKPITGPLKVDIVAAFGVPKSWSQRKRAAALLGLIRPTVKPDFDNIFKCVGDALNGVLWIDDSQIVAGGFVKKYDDRPRLRIEVERLLGEAG